MTSLFPEEVLDNILSRLPVKSLLRFRSTSKSWRSMIDSSYFIKLHLNRSMESMTNLSVLLMFKGELIIGYDSVDRFMESGNIICHPLRCGVWVGDVSVLGYCDGLFCLFLNNTVVLWNPATRESRKLPFFHSSFKVERRRPLVLESHTYGFGYDSTSDDYKVVRFLSIQPEGEETWRIQNEIEVFRVKSNSLHNISVECPHNSHVELRQPRVLFNDALHWFASELEITAFHLGSERFVAIPSPPTDRSPPGRRISKKLENWRGRLSVFFHHFDDFTCEFDIWVMNDYGVKASWTKLITITGRELGFTLSGNIPVVTPISYSKNGAGILFQQDPSHVFWFDFERKTVKKITFTGVKRVRGYSCQVVYTESLVSLNVGGGTRFGDGGDSKELQGGEGWSYNGWRTRVNRHASEMVDDEAAALPPA